MVVDVVRHKSIYRVMLSLIIANNDVAVVMQAIGLNLLFNLNQIALRLH